jgi:hypothetical protein
MLAAKVPTRVGLVKFMSAEACVNFGRPWVFGMHLGRGKCVVLAVLYVCHSDLTMEVR